MNTRKKGRPPRPLRIMNGIKNSPFVFMFSRLTTDCGLSRKLILTKNFHDFHHSRNRVTPGNCAPKWPLWKAPHSAPSYPINFTTTFIIMFLYVLCGWVCSDLVDFFFRENITGCSANWKGKICWGADRNRRGMFYVH